MADEWVPVNEDLPLIEKGRNHVSVDVIVLTKSGEQIPGFFSHDFFEWYRDDGRKIKEKVVAWKSKGA